MAARAQPHDSWCVGFIARARVVMALVLAAGVPACRSGDGDSLVLERRQSGTVVFNLASEPTTLDPARATRLAGLRVIGQCLQGLTRIGPDGRPAPAAAESWEVSPDGRTYRFHLRGGSWSNGDRVRAGDFAFAWRRVLDPETRAYWANLFFGIDGAEQYYGAAPEKRSGTPLGIETPDDASLVVRLKRPVPYFLSLLALEPFSPVHPATVQEHGEAAFRAPHFVSNGPFKLTEHTPRRRIVLDRWTETATPGRATEVRRLVFVMIENEFTEWTAYRRGEIDVTNEVHRSALAKLRAEKDFTTAPLVGTAYLAFNCKEPPFDRAEVRRAFARALDRRLLVKHITRGDDIPATGFVPPGVHGGPRGGDFRAEGGDLLSADGPNTAEAEQLRAVVASLGGEPTYSYDANELQRSLAVALQMMWRQTLGVEVPIQSFPARLLGQNKHRGDYRIAKASWVADYLDATTFLDVFRSDSANNTTNWSSAQYDALLDRGAATADPAERAGLLHRAERLLLNEMPICPLYFYAVAYLQRPGLEGVHRNRLGRIDFSHAGWVGDGR